MPLPEIQSPGAYFAVPHGFVIEIQGSEAAKVVNNLCTNDILKLPAGNCAETFVTDVRGWVVAHGMVFRMPGGVLLVGSHPDASRICDHVDRYIIREDAQVHDLTSDKTLFIVDQTSWAQTSTKSGLESLLAGAFSPLGGQSTDEPAVGIAGHSATVLSGQLSSVPVLLAPLPITGPEARVICCDAINAAAVQETLAEIGLRLQAELEFHRRRVANFWPLSPQDIGEKTIPQELDRDARAISFTKGCYLGQETIARLDARGQLQKKLSLIEMETDQLPELDQPLTNSEKEVGRITSIAWSPSGDRALALAILRRGNFQPGTELQCAGRLVRVLPVTPNGN